MTLRRCGHEDRPLVIYLDDFVVNYAAPQSVAVGETFHALIATLTGWNQIMTVAYSEAVRDLLYEDGPEERLLLDSMGDPKHMTWAGHVAIVTTFAFHALQELVHFCSDVRHRKRQQRQTKNDRPVVRNKHPLESSLRPPLDASLRLSAMAESWTARHESWDCHAAAEQTCAFAWVAMRREEEMSKIHSVSDILQYSEGWEYVTKWPPTSYGLYATAHNGTAVLGVNDLRVNTITIFYMKSYSEKWQDSAVEATVVVGNHTVATQMLSGFHEKRRANFSRPS